MDLDDSKAHLIAIRYLRTDCNHSAASAVPPGTISLRLFPNMVISFICHFGLMHLGWYGVYVHDTWELSMYSGA